MSDNDNPIDSEEGHSQGEGGSGDEGMDVDFDGNRKRQTLKNP